MWVTVRTRPNAIPIRDVVYVSGGVTVEAAHKTAREDQAQTMPLPLTVIKFAINVGCQATPSGFADLGLASGKRHSRGRGGGGRFDTNSTWGLVNFRWGTKSKGRLSCQRLQSFRWLSPTNRAVFQARLGSAGFARSGNRQTDQLCGKLTAAEPYWADLGRLGQRIESHSMRCSDERVSTCSDFECGPCCMWFRYR